MDLYVTYMSKGILKVDVGVELKNKLEEVAKKRINGFASVSEIVRTALRSFLEEMEHKEVKN